MIYGLPYTMHIEDIERLEELSELTDNYTTNPGVNTRRERDGWVLLDIKQERIGYGGGPVYILGVPRPKFCSGDTYNEDLHPAHLQKVWNHDKKEWQCRWCIEDTAHYENVLI